MSCQHKGLISTRLSCIENGWLDKYPELTAFCSECGWLVRLRDMLGISKYRKAEAAEVEISIKQILQDGVFALNVIAYCLIASTPSFKDNTLTEADGELRERIKAHDSIQQETRGQSGEKA